MNIRLVELETGLSVEALRQWERRYSFPVPERDESGDRIYSNQQILKLKLIKKLMDLGERPGQLIPLSISELRKRTPPPSAFAVEEKELIETLKTKTPEALNQYLLHHLKNLGLERFVLERMPCWTEAVGRAWAEGELSIHEEHLFSSVTMNALHSSFSTLLPPLAQSAVMLATLPGEKHGMGLLMLEALLRGRRIPVTNFGLELPTQEIVLAAKRWNYAIVALSFAASNSPRNITLQIEDLRSRLPKDVKIWVGGTGLSPRLPKLPKVFHFKDFSQLLKELGS